MTAGEAQNDRGEAQNDREEREKILRCAQDDSGGTGENTHTHTHSGTAISARDTGSREGIQVWKRISCFE